LLAFFFVPALLADFVVLALRVVALRVVELRAFFLVAVAPSALFLVAIELFLFSDWNLSVCANGCWNAPTWGTRSQLWSF
jgi:hypothetical protein